MATARRPDQVVLGFALSISLPGQTDLIWISESKKPVRHKGFVELRGIEPLTPSMP